MSAVLSILVMLAGVGSLVCWIMVLIQMFKNAGVVHGILGIICGLYAFIWGWMNASAYNLKNIMLAWTGCIVVSVLLQGALMTVLGGSAVSGM
jgi:hypothetical protein